MRKPVISACLRKEHRIMNLNLDVYGIWNVYMNKSYYTSMSTIKLILVNFSGYIYEKYES